MPVIRPRRRQDLGLSLKFGDGLLGGRPKSEVAVCAGSQLIRGGIVNDPLDGLLVGVLENRVPLRTPYDDAAVGRPRRELLPSPVEVNTVDSVLVGSEGKYEVYKGVGSGLTDSIAGWGGAVPSNKQLVANKLAVGPKNSPPSEAL